MARTDAFLPLTAVVFEILLALADAPRHGYEIMLEVERRAEGRVTLHAGTLYRALARLFEQRLIDELDGPPAGRADGHDDERRRYYRMTVLGRAVAAAEADRLAGQVNAARAKRLLAKSEKAS